MVYLFIVPQLPSYRQLVNQREKDRASWTLPLTVAKKLINSFTPREREAVMYLEHQKDKIQENYHKFTGARQLPSNLVTLDQRWERFCWSARCLSSPQKSLKINQSSSCSQPVESSVSRRWKMPKTRRRNEFSKQMWKFWNAVSRHLTNSNAASNSSKVNCSQSKTFSGYLNDEIVTMSTPEKFSLLDFEQLSDSIAMTKQMLDSTSDAMGALDAHNRQMGNYELLPNSNS